MKLNYKNTALGLIDNPKKFSFGFPDPDMTPFKTPKELKDFGYSLVRGADQLKALCGRNVQLVSQSFLEAFGKGAGKLKDAILNEEIEDSGVLIGGGFTNGYTHWHTYYYYVRTYFDENGKWTPEILFMDFSKHSRADEPALDIFVSMAENTGVKDLIWNGYIEDGRDITYWCSWIIAFVFFKKYCPIETKVIKAEKKDHHIGIKYVNETKHNIEILDSTWFTTLVKSEGFGVRGHFRFQPCGPGLKLRKLIWIDAFEKEGYTRQAKVLNQNQNNENNSI